MTTFIARDLKDLKSLRKKITNKKISMVPTMGSLHEGHLSLVRKAKKVADIVIVTIFVNPIQFNNKEDLDKYPDYESEDIKKLKAIGTDIVFLPKLVEVYPPEYSTYIRLEKYNDILCAVNRKNHFVGVATIITKLFFLLKPNFAIFGEKDFQQLMIIKKLVKDLYIDSRIISIITIRDKNGLALSSRNNLLNATEYKKAIFINKLLKKGKKYKFDKYKKLLSDTTKEFKSIGLKKIDYLDIRDEKELKSFEEFKEADNVKFRLFIAIYVGKIRLIDNMRIN